MFCIYFMYNQPDLSPDPTIQNEEESTVVGLGLRSQRLTCLAPYHHLGRSSFFLLLSSLAFSFPYSSIWLQPFESPWSCHTTAARQERGTVQELLERHRSTSFLFSGSVKHIICHAFCCLRGQKTIRSTVSTRLPKTSRPTYWHMATTSDIFPLCKMVCWKRLATLLHTEISSQASWYL